MESNTEQGKTATVINIQKYIISTLKDACFFILKDFLPENYNPSVVPNNIGNSDYTSPVATQVFNMCGKKENFPYKTIEELADAIKNAVKDEKQAIDHIKVLEIFPQEKKKKKDDKKEETKGGEEGKEEGKKKKKEKQIPKTFYLNIYLKSEWADKEAINILRNGVKLDSIYSNRKVAVDFSSPNIAKEMHVGHLRSTILGESICRILEFLGNTVVRINHVGDWGTQFGMLISYLECINPNYAEEPEKCGNIRDLEEFYKNAKKKFDDDPEFKKKSQLKTVDLQKGDKDARKAWEFICQISRENFNNVYKKLDVHLEEVGESFYDPLCRELIPELEKKGFVVEDKGAKILRVTGKQIPMILVKSDGGIGYDTTDIAALNYRVNTLNCDWLIYVVASEQGDHFKILFEAGKMCQIFDPKKVRIDHMGFGLVQGKDGKKISTRKGGSVKLIDLLEEAGERAAAEMNKRNEKNAENQKLSEEYIKEASEKIGCSAVKYYDLKQFRTSGYKFDWDKMLDDKGNTAVYLFYSYVRICSIFRKNDLSDEQLVELAKKEEIKITEEKEKNLVMHILRFADVIDDVLKDLALNLLCDYVYGLAVKFSEFYEACKIAGNNSRILIAYLCKKMMKQSFYLLSLTPIEKI